MGVCSLNNTTMKKKMNKVKKNNEGEESTRTSHSAPSIHLLLKVLTTFGQLKPQGLVFISPRYPYFGFSCWLHFQVKYIFHLA